MNTLLIIAFLFGCAVGVIITLTYARRLTSQNAENNRVETKMVEIENTELQKEVAYHKGMEAGRKEGFNDFALIVTPLYKEKSIGYLGAKKTEYEFGYIYQLTIKGVPCL